MKKTILVILAVIAVVVAAAPFAVGFVAESRLQALLDDLNKENIVDFTIIKVNRGWFSSEAIIEGELSVCLAKSMGQTTTLSGSNVATPKLTLQSTIYHGPFPLIGGSFSLVPVTGLVDTKFIRGVDDDEELINIDYEFEIEMAMSGNNEINMIIPEWEGPLGEAESISWKGLEANIKLTEGLKKAKIKLNAPYLKIDSKEGGFLLEGVNLSSNTRKGIEGMSLGTGQFDVGKIEISNSAKGTDLKLGKTSFAADTGAIGDNINSHVEFRMEKLSVAGQTYGQAFLSMDFRNLQAAALARIQKQMDELSCQTNIPADQSSSLLMAALTAEMTNLLEQGPEIEIGELSIDSPHGKMITTASAKVDTSRPQLLSNPLLALGALVAEVDVEVPEGLLVAFNMGVVRNEFKNANIQYTEEQLRTMAERRVEGMMNGPAAQFFVKSGDVYKFSASFKEGVPMMNGEPFQIPLFGAPPESGAPLQ